MWIECRFEPLHHVPAPQPKYRHPVSLLLSFGVFIVSLGAVSSYAQVPVFVGNEEIARFTECIGPKAHLCGAVEDSAEDVRVRVRVEVEGRGALPALRVQSRVELHDPQPTLEADAENNESMPDEPRGFRPGIGLFTEIGLSSLNLDGTTFRGEVRHEDRTYSHRFEGGERGRTGELAFGFEFRLGRFSTFRTRLSVGALFSEARFAQTGGTIPAAIDAVNTVAFTHAPGVRFRVPGLLEIGAELELGIRVLTAQTQSGLWGESSASRVEPVIAPRLHIGLARSKVFHIAAYVGYDPFQQGYLIGGSLEIRSMDQERQ